MLPTPLKELSILVIFSAFAHLGKYEKRVHHFGEIFGNFVTIMISEARQILLLLTLVHHHRGLLR